MSTTEKLTNAEIAAAMDRHNAPLDSAWQLQDGKLHKEFRFDNFVNAMAFMQTAGEHAEAMDHHPEWCNVYNRVSIDLVTHSVGGLSDLDFKLAEKIEAVANAL